MKLFRGGLLFAFVALAGCGEDAPVTPPPPAPTPGPPPEPPPPPPGPDADAIPIGFGGVIPASGTALTLHPGTEFLVPVMVDGDLSQLVRSPDWTGIPVRVVTDAPENVLSVAAELTIEAGREPDLLAIRALESAEVTAEVHTVRLEPPPEGFPELSGLSFRLEAEPIRFRLMDHAPAAEPDCGGLSLGTRDGIRRGDGGALGENWFGDLGRDFRFADLVPRSPGPDADSAWSRRTNNSRTGASATPTTSSR